MTPHTPGPWTIEVWDYSHETPPRKELVIQTHSHRIAVLDWNGGQDNPYTIHEQEAKANARLIAKAPNLLKALKEIVKGEGQFSRDPFTHAVNTIEDMQSIAIEAIKQVERE